MLPRPVQVSWEDGQSLVHSLAELEECLTTAAREANALGLPVAVELATRSEVFMLTVGGARSMVAFAVGVYAALDHLPRLRRH